MKTDCVFRKSVRYSVTRAKLQSSTQ